MQVASIGAITDEEENEIRFAAAKDGQDVDERSLALGGHEAADVDEDRLVVAQVERGTHPGPHV